MRLAHRVDKLVARLSGTHKEKKKQNTGALEEHDVSEEQEEVREVWDGESVGSKAGDGVF